MKVYLGTSYGHGSAVAAISDSGELLFAIEEGKLLNDKNTSKFPEESLSLIKQKIGGHDVIWAEGWDAWRRFLFKGLVRTVKYGLRDPGYFQDSLAKELTRIRSGQAQYHRYKKEFGRVRYVGHHLAHAYSLIPVGLPPKSLVLVSDTTSESSSISSYYYSGTEMSLVSSTPFPHSIGAVFHQLAHHLGFKGRTGPGKLMALAAFGKPIYLEDLRRIGNVSNGIFRIDLNIFPAWKRKDSWLSYSENAQEKLQSEIIAAKDAPELGVDLAASMQAWFTEMTWKCIEQSLILARDKYGSDISHIGLSGGGALNCRANGSFWSRISGIGVKALTVGPWSDDSGTAIGAAVWGMAQRECIKKIKKSHPFIGTNASPYTELSDASNIDAAVRFLTEGHVIALASGKLEFGPRALGGRCLLADPRHEKSRVTLNHIKSRPAFMPVAPVVLADDFDIYFEGTGSRYMSWTVAAKEYAHQHIPACVHIDGHSRVQVLSVNDAPLLEKLLNAFKMVTGHGVLILTSLNGSGEAVPPYYDRAEKVARRLGTAGILSDHGWLSFNDKRWTPDFGQSVKVDIQII